MSANMLRDDRAPSFFMIGDITRKVAELHCGVSVDQVTHARWRELMGLLREFDTLVDDTSISRDEALELLHDFNTYRDTYPHLAPDTLPDTNRERLERRTAVILRWGDAASTCRDTDTFIKTRIYEGYLTASLLADSATPETEQQFAFYDRFMPVMRSMAATACLLDTLTDAEEDYEEGKLAIVPSRAFSRALLTSAAHESRLARQALAHPSILGQFCVMSVTRLNNRIKHGKQPYSSLKHL